MKPQTARLGLRRAAVMPRLFPYSRRTAWQGHAKPFLKADTATPPPTTCKELGFSLCQHGQLKTPGKCHEQRGAKALLFLTPSLRVTLVGTWSRSHGNPDPLPFYRDDGPTRVFLPWSFPLHALFSGRFRPHGLFTRPSISPFRAGARFSTGTEPGSTALTKTPVPAE